MNTPAALRKAESLANFATHCGSPKAEFAIALSRAEAYELLDYLEAGHMGRVARQRELEADIREARAAGEPFRILKDWQLLGFSIVPTTELH